ncbi:hypothetical protein LAZ67_7002198 [Cordylochernes scorpioides]|uniref:Uncharacterized protein n=1 Tax=Cordylochernes scorpioides TaxID=51811 RepID=A0ABY6KNW1_9ARAC|nr:hypothetical protein LAZ67_7002198 [Cordylochernes scorpioides]
MVIIIKQFKSQLTLIVLIEIIKDEIPDLRLQDQSENFGLKFNIGKTKFIPTDTVEPLCIGQHLVAESKCPLWSAASPRGTVDGRLLRGSKMKNSTRKGRKDKIMKDKDISLKTKKITVEALSFIDVKAELSEKKKEKKKKNLLKCWHGENYSECHRQIKGQIF